MSRTAEPAAPTASYRQIVEQEAVNREAYLAQRLLHMNDAAQLLADNGPSDDINHFLFAMHGIDGPEETETERLYRSLESRFQGHTTERVFTTPADRESLFGSRVAPFSYRMWSRGLLNDYFASSKVQHRNEFSAVEYHVDVEHHHVPVFVGRLVVPTFVVGADSDRVAQEPLVLIAMNRPADEAAAYNVNDWDNITDAGQVLFQNAVVKYAEDGSMSHLQVAVQKLQAAHAVLKAAIAQA